MLSARTHHSSNGRPHIGVAEVQVRELLQAGQQAEQVVLSMRTSSLPAQDQPQSASC